MKTNYYDDFKKVLKYQVLAIFALDALEQDFNEGLNEYSQIVEADFKLSMEEILLEELCCLYPEYMRHELLNEFGLEQLSLRLQEHYKKLDEEYQTIIRNIGNMENTDNINNKKTEEQ